MPAALLLLLAAIALLPKPAHYVTDRAGVVKNADAINEKLANFERQTSDQILVYVDQHLPPNSTIEEMGAEAMRKWGVGQKGKDNGAILFVFIGDRKMRIEVGYGLEGSLTDAKAKWITSTVMKPEFQRGDFDAGINHGVDAMLATVRGEAYRGSGRTFAQTRQSQAAGPLGCLQILMMWALLVPAGLGLGWSIQDGISGRSLFFVALGMPSIAIFIWLWRTVPKSSDYGSVVFFTIVFPLGVGLAVSLREFLGRLLATMFRMMTMLRMSGGSGSSSDEGSSFSSSSDSSSSSSDFSGGGGSGGGGGASDSW